MIVTATAPTIAAGMPRPRRWTCEQFHALGDMGLFEGRGAMLVAGEILEFGPMNPPHAVVLEQVEDAVRAMFGPPWRLRIQMPLVLGADTDPMPDLAVVSGQRDRTTHPRTAALVVEVADTSLRFDTGEKANLYAASGIADYWVVDVNGSAVIVHRSPQQASGLAHGHEYADVRTYRPGEDISPVAMPGASVAVAALVG